MTTLDPPRRRRGPGRGRLADRTFAALMLVGSAVALGLIAWLLVRTALRSGGAWSTFGVWGFLSGTHWIPQVAHGNPLFGAAPLLYGTVMTSLIALVIATPVAVGVALATTVFLPARLRRPVASIVDLLAAVPSVVYGIWGLLVLVPLARPVLSWIGDHSGGIPLLGGPVISGQSFLAAGLVLAVMIIPIIAAVSREVFLTVPREQCEAALALGATRWEMVRGAMLPWARSGIVGACALGLGRAVGETIAIALILGGDTNSFLGSLLRPGATLASTIALQIQESTSALNTQALVALGVVVFLLSLAINALARVVVARAERGPRGRRGRRGRRPARAAAEEVGASPAIRDGRAGERLLAGVSRRRRIRARGAQVAILGLLGLSLVPLGLILGTILVRGVPALSWDFLTQAPPGDPNSFAGGIGNALAGTLVMMGICCALAAPLGLLTALLLTEAESGSRRARRAGAGLGFAIDVLLGVPSIVVGLIVYTGIVLAQGRYSGLAGGVALAIIMYPIATRSCHEILRLVPGSLREASLALGARRWRTAWSVVLPAAAPGLVTGMMLALARAAGEAAPLLFTSADSQVTTWNPNDQMASLPRQIYQDVVATVTPATERRAWGAALVLAIMILLLTLGARLAARRPRTRRSPTTHGGRVRWGRR